MLPTAMLTHQDNSTKRLFELDDWSLACHGQLPLLEKASKKASNSMFDISVPATSKTPSFLNTWWKQDFFLSFPSPPPDFCVWAGRITGQCECLLWRGAEEGKPMTK